jgi:hypothetical protein
VFTSPASFAPLGAVWLNGGNSSSLPNTLTLIPSTELSPTTSTRVPQNELSPLPVFDSTLMPDINMILYLCPPWVFGIGELFSAL